MPRIFPYATEAEWLALRHQDVTSTEVAALFGLSPYLTKFELYHRKRSPDVPAPIEGNARMRWGQRLEAVIAEGVAEDEGLDVEPLKSYYRHASVDRMGASFDYRVTGHCWTDRPRSDGLLEVKNVDSLAFKQGWEYEPAPAADADARTLTAPAHIEIQVQAQLEVADLDWAVIAAFVGGNTPVLLYRQRDREVGAAIRSAVTQFWADVAANLEPAPDFSRDLDTLKRLYGHAEPGKSLQVGADNRIAGLMLADRDLSADLKRITESRDAIKAELLTLIGDAEKITTPYGSISAGLVGPAHIAYDREGYRNIKFNHKKVLPASAAITTAGVPGNHDE